MIKAYFNVFRNYANFSGTLHRKPYWQAVILHLIILLIPLYPLALMADGALNSEKNLFFIIYSVLILYYLFSLVPFWAATVRRLHDLPKSGWFLLLNLIPGIGSLILLVFLLRKGRGETVEQELVRLFPKMKTVLGRPRNGKWAWTAILVLAAGVFSILKFDSVRDLYDIFNDMSIALFEQTDARIPEEINEFAKMVMDKVGLADDEASAGTRQTDAVPTVSGAEEGPADVVTEAPVRDVQSSFPARRTDAKAISSSYNPESESVISTLNSDNALETGTNPESEGIAYPENSELLSRDVPLDQPGTILSNVMDQAFVVSVGDPAAEKGIFWIDMMEVSNNQYQRCMEADVCSEPADLTLLSIPDYFEDTAEYGDFPVIHVSRSQAADYCNWVGRRLPTEVEWELAAASADGRAFPWGDAFNPRKLNYADSDDLFTAAVSAYRNGGSSAGVLNLLGNVWEWTAPSASLSDSNNAEIAIVRGGGWNSYADTLSSALRYEVLPEYSAANVGFRCAVTEVDRLLYRALDEEETALFTELPLNIGSERERETDGAVEMYVPAAAFTMGNASGAVNERPAHAVSLDTYWIDRSEVSNSQYAACVSESACSEPAQTKSFKNPFYYGNTVFAVYPVILVSWEQAAQYCEWVGGRLPTEAEWENAARGPEGYRYPWGNTFEGSNLNYSGSGINDTEPVNSYESGVSGYGVLNMSGNVAEWVFDRYAEDWYKNAPEENPIGPDHGYFRVVRGGSWQNGESNAQASNRFFANETSSSLDRGFRCVRPE